MGEIPFKTNSRKWFGLNILDILFAKTPKKQHNIVQILQRVDADKENKVREIDRDCKCKFSYTCLDKVVQIKQESGQSIDTHQLREKQKARKMRLQDLSLSISNKRKSIV